MQYLRLTFVSLVACVFAAVLSGCGSSVMNSMAGNTPSVSAVGAEANGVAPNRWIYVQFNEAMDPSTINNQTMVITDSSGRPATGSVTYNSDFSVAGFQPNPALDTSTSYTLKVTTGAKSAQGVPLLSDFKYNFTTRADTDKSPIGVKTVTPANGACASANTLITITFTEGAEVSTLTSSNIVITGPGNAIVPAKISYNVATAQATISPNAALPSGTITVTVSNVSDAAGVAMTTPYTWSFSTACTSGGGGTPTTQYMAPLTSWNPKSSPLSSGQVTVDTSGMVSMQLMGAPAGRTYDVQFCEAVAPFAPNQPTSCIEITKITTSATGSAGATAKFPQSGNWAGDFVFLDSSGNLTFSTYIPSNATNATYTGVLLPVNDTNGGADVYNPGPQLPLSSGSVNVAGSTATFTVKGAAASFSFETNVSETSYIDSSGTYEMCTFNTDAQGNGSCSASVSQGSGGDIFQVGPQNAGSTGNGYIAGFSVPQ